MDDPQARPLLPRPLRSGELVALDALAAAGYALVLLLSAYARAPDVPAWAVVVLVGGIALPVALRRRWPWPVVAVSLAASLLAMVLGVVREPFLAAAYALYLAALQTPRHRREPIVAIAVASVVGLLLLVLAGPGPGAEALYGLMVALAGGAVLGGAWTIGRAVRERRVYAARRAAQLAADAASDERLRLARDLHDVVSHTLSMIGVKAGVARHVADTRPAEVREALQVIEDTSREALVEMGRMLGVLRTDPPDRLRGDPVPSLPELAARAAAAGVPVELAVTGLDRLPAGVADDVVRVVQEAVTNVVRHAVPARCRVVVEAAEDGVRVEVTDDGAGRPSAGRPGYGLVGMRERVARHGGTFTAGPRTEGGFAVSAWLPVAAATVPAPGPGAA